MTQWQKPQREPPKMDAASHGHEAQAHPASISAKIRTRDDAGEELVRSVIEEVVENATTCSSENLSVVPSERVVVQAKPSCCPALFPVRCCPYLSEPRSEVLARPEVRSVLLPNPEGWP
jgi:hypothetical protein